MGIKIFAPATINNLAVGIDVLSLSLDSPGDDIILNKSKTDGLTISKITGNKSLSDEVHNNVAGIGALNLLKHMGKEHFPFEMEIHKKFPFDAGLGSRSASAVAGVVAVNEFFNNPMTKREILPFALQALNFDNKNRPISSVIASLIGGITLVRDNATTDFTRIHAPKGINILIILPRLKAGYKKCRVELNKEVSLEAAIHQATNLASFVSGCYASNFELIKRSLEDHIAEEQRSGLIPLYNEMRDIAYGLNALAFNISGAGPAMFALCKNSLDMENILEAANKLYKENKIAIKTYTSGINLEGAYKY